MKAFGKYIGISIFIHVIVVGLVFQITDASILDYIDQKISDLKTEISQMEATSITPITQKKKVKKSSVKIAIQKKKINTPSLPVIKKVKPIIVESESEIFEAPSTKVSEQEQELLTDYTIEEIHEAEQEESSIAQILEEIAKGTEEQFKNTKAKQEESPIAQILEEIANDTEEQFKNTKAKQEESPIAQILEEISKGTEEQFKNIEAKQEESSIAQIPEGIANDTEEQFKNTKAKQAQDNSIKKNHVELSITNLIDEIAKDYKEDQPEESGIEENKEQKITQVQLVADDEETEKLIQKILSSEGPVEQESDKSWLRQEQSSLNGTLE